MYIKLTNSQKRTAELFLLSLTPPKSHRTIVRTPQGNVEPGKQAIFVRKPNWTGALQVSEIGTALIQGDPEVDTNLIGRPVQIRSSVYLNEARQPVHDFRVLEEKLLPDGSVRETKPYQPTEPNLGLPIQLLAKGTQAPGEMLQKFVVHKIYQVIHLDNLSYDFLYNLCQELHQHQGFARLAGGIKGNEPLILRREGLPAFAYIRGRVRDHKYCCTIHLTHQELRPPAIATAQPAAN